MDIFTNILCHLLSLFSVHNPATIRLLDLEFDEMKQPEVQPIEEAGLSSKSVLNSRYLHKPEGFAARRLSYSNNSEKSDTVNMDEWVDDIFGNALNPMLTDLENPLIVSEKVRGLGDGILQPQVSIFFPF